MEINRIGDPGAIEKKSMEIIGEELLRMGVELSPQYDFIVKRVIHTTADFDFANNLVFSPGAVETALSVLRGDGAGSMASGTDAISESATSRAKEYTPVIVTDTNMTLSGVSKPGLKKLGASAVCYMADEDVAAEAAELGITRAVVSVRKAVRKLGESEDMSVRKLGESESASVRKPGETISGVSVLKDREPLGKCCIYAVGNAPTALFELISQMELGFRPALIIAVPVGFVNVIEAKEAVVAACEKYGVPYIAAMGRKGGSTVSAAILNALIYRACGDR